MDDDKKTFVLGLGHQKCCTTWLYDYLAQSPLFCRGFAKEAHIWDETDVELLAANRVDIWSRAAKFVPGTRSRMRHKFQKHPAQYFNYYSTLLSGAKTLTADITPEYCTLKAERLQNIQQRFQERNVDVKSIILIRDPLARIKSAVRFNLDRSCYCEGIKFGEKDFSKALAQYYQNEHCELRTRYYSIITEAKKVFSEESLYVGIYENMFTPEELSRLSRFLGVPVDHSYTSVKVNQTRGQVEDTALDSDIKAYYSDVYDFCFENYPVTQELWA